MTVQDFIKNKTSFTAKDLLVTSVQKLSTTTGKDYLAVTARDATASISFKIWQPLARMLEDEIAAGRVLRVSANYEEYRGVPQMGLLAAVCLSPEESAALCDEMSMPGDLDIQALTQEFLTLISAVSDKNLRAATLSLFGDPTEDIPGLRVFTRAPGGVMVHHAHTGGLLLHTLSVMNSALDMARWHKHVNKDVLICAAALHDYGKIFEYTINNGVPEKTLQGALLGHIALSLPYIDRAMKTHDVDPEKALNIMHCVLSHHGRKEWGSPVEPSSPEAVLISSADLADATLNGLMQAGEELGPGYSEKRCLALDNRKPWFPTHSYDANKPEDPGPAENYEPRM